MLFRVFIILLIIFGLTYSFLWLVSSTKYFNEKRIKKILKNMLLGIAAVVLTAMAFSTIVNFDHLF